MKTFQLLLLLLVSYSTLKPDEIGVKFNYGLLFQRADFRNFPSVDNCCPLFADGSGFALSFNAFYNYNLNPNSMIGLSLGYNRYDSELARKEPTTITNNVDAIFEHRIEPIVSDISLTPNYSHRVWGDLWANAGLHLGYINSGQFSQVEQLVTPDNATFENGSSTRNEVNDADIPNLSSYRVAFQVGLSYNLPLNKDSTWIIAPEVFYQYGLTDIVEERDWNFNILSFGVAIKYDRSQRDEEYIPIEEPAEEIDEIVLEKKAKPSEDISKSNVTAIETAIDIELGIVGLSDEGNELEIAEMKIEEFLNFRAEPLLPYVFFDENSSDIPERYNINYNSEISNFAEKSFKSDSTLEIYYNILNIVGNRLREQKDAKITLVGTNSNSGEETGNDKLSKRRAESVKKYLVNAWVTDPVRIEIETRDLPEKSSNPNTREGIEENRRVEIYSDNPKILDIVQIEDTLRTSNPPSIRFKTKTDKSAKVWELEVYQGNKSLKTFSGQGKMPDEIDWNLQNEQKNIPRFGKSISAIALVANKDGVFSRDTSILKTDILKISEKRRKKIDDKYITEFNLILFDFNSSKIEDQNQQIIELVKEYIEPKSEVEIIGYTDKTGDEALNLKLSENRAKSAKQLLDHSDVNLDAVGESNELFPFDLPEGRMYARTVKIVIETPIEE